MNKRKSWILTVFAVVAVVSIAVALVLFNKFNQNDGEKSFNESEENLETYATSFYVALPDTIQILIGTKVNLINDYIVVSPSSIMEKLTYEITPQSSGTVGGIAFQNNSITANSLGSYTLKFKMPKSQLTYFSKTINILVYEEKQLSHVQQNISTLIIGETKDLMELFQIKELSNYNVVGDKVAITHDTITAQQTGEATIKFSFIENNVKYNYEFILIIKDEPLYRIVLDNVSNNIISLALDNSKQINFNVLNRNEEDVDQSVKATSANENIAVVERVIDPLIKIVAIGKGETIITIYLENDPTIKVEVLVIVQ